MQIKEGETMSLTKYLVSGAAALALIGGAVSAVAASSDPISVECDGTGDYLLAPVYYAVNTADQKWKTDIKVVNTNTTYAVVAKVVVRDGNQSNELIDFPIYLTPGDVWTGRLEYNETDGKVHVVSEDDSLMLGTEVKKVTTDNCKGAYVLPKFQASSENRFNRPVNLGAGEKQTRGYVEVYGLASYKAEDIAKAYGDSFQPGCDLNKTIFYSYVRYPAVQNNIHDLNDTGAKDVANSDLMGIQTIIAEADDNNLKRTMMLNMFALGGIATEAKTDAVISSHTDLNKVSDLNGNYGTLANVLRKAHVYAVYEGDGNNLSPMRLHFTMPFKSEMGYGSYTLDTKDDIIFRDMEEHAHRDCVTCPEHTAVWPCQKIEQEETSGSDVDSDISGQDEPTPPSCTPDSYPYTQEVATILDTSKDPMKTKAFKVGGYVDINLTKFSGGGLPVVPTSFYAKKMGDLYLNNHLYNQYNLPAQNNAD